MFLRKIVNGAKRLTPDVRAKASQGGPLVDLIVDNDGVSIMTIQKPPVNSLNLDLLKEISSSLDEVAKNKSKGLVLTSSLSTVFSAGLDFTEIYKPDLKRAEEFSTTLQDVYLKLFGSNFATATAINGHASAGGCFLSMLCEYRVMVRGKFTIGLNETTLGIVPSTWLMDIMCNTISVREAEYALTTSRMFTVEEALKVRLIDEIANDKADAINKCKGFIKKFDKIPALARSVTKQRMRQAPLKRLLDNRKANIEQFLTLVKDPKMQQSLDVYIQGLKKNTSN